jgi:hypothetical protein
MALFLQSGMDAGEIREQDPALLLFMPYTAVVGSLTEASVLNAVVGKDRARRRSDAAMREVVAFVRSALQPAQPWNIRSLIRVAEGLRERQERLVDR